MFKLHRFSEKLRGKQPFAKKQSGGTRTTRKQGLPIGAARRIFHAVSVQPDQGDCCDAVAQIQGRRYLSDEAPLLPLADCTRSQDCKCRYEHYDDRRTNVRRDTDQGLPEKLRPEEDREGPGRRVTDG